VELVVVLEPLAAKSVFLFWERLPQAWKALWAVLLQALPTPSLCIETQWLSSMRLRPALKTEWKPLGKSVARLDQRSPNVPKEEWTQVP